MGNCCVQFKLVRNRMTIRRRRRIVLLLVGLDNAGKTATVRGLLGEDVRNTVPTVGFSSHNLSFRGYSVVLYDVGGGPQIRDIWSQYYVDVHGVIFVIDASDPSRMNECRLLLHQLLTHEKLKGKPLLLLANKQDIDGALDEIDVVERLNLEIIVNQQKCPTLVETSCAAPSSEKSKSCKTVLDPGIKNGFRWILNQIVKDFHTLNQRVEEDTEIAQAELILEKERRRVRVEEHRQQREEAEGTTIIPLRDYSPDSLKSRIITVVPSDDKSGKFQEDVVLPNGSQDSGFTVQNGDTELERQSSESIRSKDSAVQSMHVEKAEDTKPSLENNSTDSKQKITKRKVFLKRSNKTAPAEFVPQISQEVTAARPTPRHRLPPLTPPPNHVKVFEVKPRKNARLNSSLSLSFEKSESDLTDEERSLNLVSFPSDWKLLRHKEGDKEENVEESEQEKGFGKTFIVSSGVTSSLKQV